MSPLIPQREECVGLPDAERIARLSGWAAEDSRFDGMTYCGKEYTFADAKEDARAALRAISETQSELEDTNVLLMREAQYAMELKAACVKVSGWLESFACPGGTTTDAERREHIKILDDAIYRRGKPADEHPTVDMLHALEGLARICDNIHQITCITNEPRTCGDDLCNHYLCREAGCIWRHVDNARVVLLHARTTPSSWSSQGDKP